MIYSLLFAQLSQKEAYEIVKSQILKSDTTDIHLYVSEDMITPKSIIETMHKDIISPDFISWMFFIDDAPYQNWSHPARYVFVGPKGQIEIQAYSYPPKFDKMVILIEKKYPITDVNKKLNESFSQIQPKNLTTAQNEYAVIISGGYDRDNNYERYWNDCAAIYSTLVNVYNYDRSHIYVLVSDGTNPASDRRRLNGTYDSSPLDLDGDGTNDIQYAATKANITAVFNTLSQIMTNQDNLFIFTTDHGGLNSGQSVFMYLWNETIQDSQFATEVNKINAKSINIVMEQCHSGGFIDNLASNNRVIATACKANESSYAMPPNYAYNEFVFHWISAVAGRTPLGVTVNADANNDGFVSASEAFSYANTQNTRPETPQYSSQPVAFGNFSTLLGLLPSISGPSTVCYTNSTPSVINNKPSGAIIYWTISNTNLFSLSSSSGDQITVTRIGSGSGSATLSARTGSVSGPIIASLPITACPLEITGSASYVYCGQSSVFYITSVPGASYSWANGDLITIPYGYSKTGTSATYMAPSYLPWGESEYYDLITCTVNGTNYYKSVAVIDNSLSKVSVYPNPTSNIVNIEIAAEAVASLKTRRNLKDDPSFDIRLYDGRGNMIQQTKTKSITAQFNVSNLPNGTYYLHVHNGVDEKPEIKQIVVQH